jgi:exopolysaccharide biosynthesis polyprenyl glycosylphosphotransferase
MALSVKRAMDLLASSLALLFLSWLLFAIVLLIKATSKGPALFRQTRIGEHGKPFTFLKFRSMYVDNDATIHKEYVARLIAGKTDSPAQATPEVFKITNDPRVTPIGRILRKTSLDELPQLINVLKGQMSLIGPRPPVPYEFERYDLWHRRRVLEVKPGITGLWQVRGRSRTSFDEMVRLDLHYTRNWSLWLDFKILLDTPRAVFSGDGAY